MGQYATLLELSRLLKSFVTCWLGHSTCHYWSLERFILSYASLICSLLSNLHSQSNDGYHELKELRRIANTVLYPKSCDTVIGGEILDLAGGIVEEGHCSRTYKREHKRDGGFRLPDLAISGFRGCIIMLKRWFPPFLFLLWPNRLNPLVLLCFRRSITCLFYALMSSRVHLPYRFSPSSHLYKTSNCCEHAFLPTTAVLRSN